MNQTNNKEDQHQMISHFQLLLSELETTYYLLWSIDNTRIITKLKHS